MTSPANNGGVRRRTVLAAGGALLGGTTGCLGREDDSGGAPSADTEDPGATDPSTTVTPDEFVAAVRDQVDSPQTVSLSRGDDTWELTYATDYCCGDPLARQQAQIATLFASKRPDGVSLSATATHECTTIDWRVPADDAARYEAGEVDTATFTDRVLDTTRRTNDC